MSETGALGLPGTGPQQRLCEYLLALGALGLLTMLNGLLAPWVGYWSVALLFLLGVMALATVLSLRPALLVAALSALCWNVFFIPPVFNLHIRNLSDLLMCLTYLVVALIIAGLTRRIRAQEARVRLREQRLEVLYRFSGRLVEAHSRESLLQLAREEISQALQAEVRIVSDAQLDTVALPDLKGAVADQRIALQTAVSSYGQLEVRQPESWDQGQQHLLEILSRHLALALEREALREAATQLELNRISETLYDALLDSVSHELRTPLTTIQCALANLHQPEIIGNATWRQQLFSDLEGASLRLAHLVANLLDMSRLQSGRLQLNRAWCAPADIVNSALKALAQELAAYPLKVSLPADLPLMYVDFGLLEQALSNLIHNALTHNPPGTGIVIQLSQVAGNLRMQVQDQGPGIPVHSLPHLFEKFYRSPEAKAPGTGLGLSISQGFVEAHGGQLTVSNLSGGGACFCIHLPIIEVPHIPLEEDDAPTHSDC